MNSKIVVGILAGVMILTNIITFSKLSAVEKKVNNFKPHQINIPETMRNAMIENLSIKNGKATKDILNQITALQKSEKEANIQLDKAINELKNTQNQEIIRAEASFKMAKKLFKEGNTVEAKRYMLNAISNNPSEFEYLKYFTNMLLNDKSSTIDELNNVINLIDGLIYKIAAENINATLQIRENITARKESLVAKNAVPEININSEIKDLESGKLSLANIMTDDETDMDLLKARIEKISSLLSEAQLSEESRKKLLACLKKSSAIYSAEQTLENTQNALDKANSLDRKNVIYDYTINAARSQLTTAETLLAQIWSSDVPVQITNRAEQFKRDIEDINAKLNEIASKDALKKYNEIAVKIKKLSGDVEKNYNNYYYFATKANKSLSKNLSQAGEYIVELQSLKMYAPNGQKNIREKIAELQSLMQKIMDKRYKAYNKWAIVQIEEARKSRDGVGFKAYTDEMARRDFKKYLNDIDRGLLTYDVGTCYDKVYQLIYTEQIPDKDKARFQYEKATNPNIRKLEDF